MNIVSEEEDDSDSNPVIFLRIGYSVSAHAETFGVEVTTKKEVKCDIVHDKMREIKQGI
jgi:hypothetical protein